jgi:hypothetical protein
VHWVGRRGVRRVQRRGLLFDYSTGAGHGGGGGSQGRADGVLKNRIGEDGVALLVVELLQVVRDFRLLLVAGGVGREVGVGGGLGVGCLQDMTAASGT